MRTNQAEAVEKGESTTGEPPTGKRVVTPRARCVPTTAATTKVARWEATACMLVRCLVALKLKCRWEQAVPTQLPNSIWPNLSSSSK